MLPVSTAEYNPCGWRAWLNNTTLTLGMQNVFRSDPPFVAGAFENNYDESLATIKGRFWYIQTKEKILSSQSYLEAISFGFHYRRHHGAGRGHGSNQRGDPGRAQGEALTTPAVSPAPVRGRGNRSAR